MGVQSRGESNGETITVTKEGRWYVARDESSGVASQGETKVEALENLAEALELHARPVADTDEDLEPSTAPWH
ncbi:type II toxin-antitoxin system HicB family antitoxin [Natronorubrum sp. A-ect3]|uniref:type II toxin-antitoxin system HicB family antitoxin n=1 Tax=Natronorubrum sp. A-ect3 TaxID=3242698 RepID=UPI00359EEEDA